MPTETAGSSWHTFMITLYTHVQVDANEDYRQQLADMDRRITEARKQRDWKACTRILRSLTLDSLSLTLKLALSSITLSLTARSASAS